ncbi:MAG: cupredoxin family copper-binding protein [Patescibacteria group bacterium]|jgi:plastocyanin
MNKMITALLFIMGILLVSGCSLSGSNTTNTNLTGIQAEPVATNTISIQNFVFDPAMLTVKQGTTVTWINNDYATHTIKSDAFNSSDLANGQSFSFTFNTAGTFNYSCGIHPTMLGKIVVE